MEEEKNGITLGEIFRTIFTQKWLALIIAVIITIVGTIAFYFGYNAIYTRYTRTFSLQFPDSANTTVFPDGKAFNYNDIVSHENLARAQADGFTDIDVEGMFLSGGISIGMDVALLTETQTETTYKVVANSKYFKSESEASAFLDKLVQYPIDYIVKIAENQNVYLAEFEKTNYLEDKIAVLDAQYNYLSDGLNRYSNVSLVAKESAAIRSSLTSYMHERDSIVGELRSNHYVYDEEAARSLYTNMLASLKDEYERTCDALKRCFTDPENVGTSGNIQPTDEIVRLAEEAARLNSDITLYNGYLEDMKPVTEEFKAKLTALGATLSDITDSYEALLGKYYSGASAVSYNGALAVEGHMNIVVCLLISLAIGLVVACIVAFIVGRKKIKAAKATEKNVAAGVGVEEEQPSQISKEDKKE